ncbi:MAG: hypothetical protein E7G82_00290 [Veillonella sp.]|nr:hypothetical protein [Veillonella sp.]
MSENTINIYMGAEDKVNVKDATQIIKLQGPKGEPGPKGEDGVQGPKGEPLRFEDLTEAQKLELKGEKGETGNRDPKGEQGDNVNLETVKKLKDLLLDNNVLVKSDSLEGILLEYFEAQRNSNTVYLVGDESIAEPYITVNEGKINIIYGVTLPFRINDGEIQYMSMANISVPLPSTTENTTIKFYSARMRLMYTKLIEATL